MACLFPFFVDNPKYPYTSNERQVPVPCGSCPACLERNTAQWIFRVIEESKCHDVSRAHFVTYTFDNDNIEITPKGFMTLSKRPYQLMLKRLRKIQYKFCKQNNMEQVPIKYWLCGEYGSTTERPHYHAIIFGVIDQRWFFESWIDSEGAMLGEIHIGDVSGASIAYCAKYMSKGKTIPKHANDDRLPEFRAMSKGLGKGYLKNEKLVRWHQNNPEKPYVVYQGFKIGLPRYYRDKIYTDAQKSLQGRLASKKGQEIEKKAKQDYIAVYGSLDGYDRAKFESKKSAIRASRKKSKMLRK